MPWSTRQERFHELFLIVVYATIIIKQIIVCLMYASIFGQVLSRAVPQALIELLFLLLRFVLDRSGLAGGMNSNQARIMFTTPVADDKALVFQPVYKSRQGESSLRQGKFASRSCPYQSLLSVTLFVSQFVNTNRTPWSGLDGLY